MESNVSENATPEELLRINVVGAVAPVRGDFFSLIIPYADTEVLQVFINQLAEYTKHSTKGLYSYSTMLPGIVPLRLTGITLSQSTYHHILLT